MLLVSNVDLKSVEEFVSRFCFVQISSGPGSSPGQSDHLQSLTDHNFAALWPRETNITSIEISKSA